MYGKLNLNILMKWWLICCRTAMRNLNFGFQTSQLLNILKQIKIERGRMKLWSAKEVSTPVNDFLACLTRFLAFTWNSNSTQVTLISNWWKLMEIPPELLDKSNLGGNGRALHIFSCCSCIWNCWSISIVVKLFVSKWSLNSF